MILSLTFEFFVATMSVLHVIWQKNSHLSRLERAFR